MLKKCVVCKSKYKKYTKYCSKKCYTDTMQGSKKPSFWVTAQKEEQLKRLRKNYEKYVIRHDKGCWGWGGFLDRYGSLQYGGKYKSITAHRGSYIIHVGDVPDNMFVCHTCDNPPCTRPDHLFLGTPGDNVRDMYKKGRHIILRGEKAPWSKLTEKSVIEIKQKIAKDKNLKKLAQEYKISLSSIYDIRDERSWKHIKK